MSDLINRNAMLKHIEKTRQDALMIDDIRESNIIMRAMNLLEEVVRNQPSAQPEQEHTMEEFMYGQDMGNPEDGSL